MSKNPEEQESKKQLKEKAPRKRRTLREVAANEERFRRSLDRYIERNPDGTFAKGTPSPNPDGARTKSRRMFGMGIGDSVPVKFAGFPVKGARIVWTANGLVGLAVAASG